MTVVTAAPRPLARMRDGWRGAHEPVGGVPRWVRIAALAVPFTVLPSGLWRIAAFTLHLPIIEGFHREPVDVRGDVPSWLPMEIYVVLLSIFSEVLAFATIGLIAGWGEVFPRWVPVLRGRRVPVLAAVIPGAAGAVVLTMLWTVAIVYTLVFQQTIQGRPLPDYFPIHFHSWQGVLGVAAYAPLMAWGPLLGAVTFAYYRRRTRA